MMITRAIFNYMSETYADDNDIFIDDLARALSPIMDFLQEEVTTGTIALIQVVKDEYLFLVDAHENFKVLKVTVPAGEGKPVVSLVSESDMLKR